ncbi:MAG: PAS domain-containing sensor histidine kinase [Deltaproteobacteria bacterium]|nr:MAG: PAS domain-containing sensor histidine kinase [Deltaproteobacteria bacterium]
MSAGSRNEFLEGEIARLERELAQARAALVQATATADPPTEPPASLEAQMGEPLLRMLINAMPDIVCFKDGDGRWLEANDFDLALFELAGVDYRGKTDAELADYSPFYRDAFLTCGDTDEACWRGGVLHRGDEHIPRPDGSVQIFDVIKLPLFHPDGRRKGLLVIGRDITERRQLEARENHAAKMEAVGQLAGGVAHDFNNILTAILGLASGLARELPEGATQEDAATIHEAARRANRLTQQLLDFARARPRERTVIDVNETVEEVALFAAHTLGAKVVVTTDLASGPAAILGDADQLHQVLLNLCINARDAMPGGGRITLRTERRTLGPADVEARGVLQPGEHVVVTVSDTGSGIPAALRSRIFEPFFTTKDRGRGTGMGLAVAYREVERQKGHIRVTDAPGGGAAFELYFPVAT